MADRSGFRLLVPHMTADQARAYAAQHPGLPVPPIEDLDDDESPGSRFMEADWSDPDILNGDEDESDDD